MYLCKDNTMYKIFFILLLSLFMNSLTSGQSKVLPVIIIQNDTLPHIQLPEVSVIVRKRNHNYYERQHQKHNRTVYNVQKALPYAKIAALKINEIEQKLKTIHSEKEKKRVVKEEYKQLMKTFKQPLMKLTVTQGRILIRLIYRETQNTSFHHIKEYRGSVNAYFWQSIALLFGHNLKADYEPNGRDREIEEIVRSIEKDLYQ